MSLSTAPQQPPFGKLARQANKFIDQLQKGYYNFYPSETWSPSVNLYETAGAYQVCVDLAGVDKTKIELDVIDGRLRLKGTRLMPTFEEEATAEAEAEAATKTIRIHLLEIDHGGFSRDVELPPGIAPDQISATYRNGMLWVEIPKK